MKVKLHKASDRYYEEEVEINSIEDILAIVWEYGRDVIVKEDGSLEIYDDWLE